MMLLQHVFLGIVTDAGRAPKMTALWVGQFSI